MFEDVKFGKIFCSRDGEALSYSSQDIVPCDMQEYGRQEIISMSNDFPLKDAICKRLLSVNLVYSCFSDKIIDAMFLFEHDVYFYILNLGDELFIYKNIPEHIILKENLKFISNYK